MSRRGILVVLDGLGIGALPDVATARPQDRGADSLGHALAHAPSKLPFLTRLGLGYAARSAGLERCESPAASWGRAELGYPGADSFLGHQVLLGGDVSGVRLETFANGAAQYRRALLDAGHDARPLDDWPVLVVDGAMLVADSLEADAGMNYNVTGSLEHADFSTICAVAEIIREEAPVARVIAVGAHQTPPEAILEAVQARDGAIGIDTPGLGIYERGADILHYGRADLSGRGQLPTLAEEAGASVTLLGKMADIVACESAVRQPAVETQKVLSLLTDAVGEQQTGLIAANVQELDLAGHSESPDEYVAVLEQCDEAFAELATRLTSRDLMLITGDHGNDPTMGALHTREAVPILALAPGRGATHIGVRKTLADIGATLADWLCLPATATGTSFLEQQ